MKISYAEKHLLPGHLGFFMQSSSKCSPCSRVVWRLLRSTYLALSNSTGRLHKVHLPACTGYEIEHNRGIKALGSRIPSDSRGCNAEVIASSKLEHALK